VQGGINNEDVLLVVGAGGQGFRCRVRPCREPAGSDVSCIVEWCLRVVKKKDSAENWRQFRGESRDDQFQPLISVMNEVNKLLAADRFAVFLYGDTFVPEFRGKSSQKFGKVF
jgi:hypothetical protein